MYRRDGREQEVVGDRSPECDLRDSSQGEMMRIQLRYGQGMGKWAIRIKVRMYMQFIH